MSTSRVATPQDWQKAHDLFQSNRERVFVALFARSLPATYCSPTGAAVLDVAAHGLGFAADHHHRAMIGDSFRRLTRTVQFLEEMFATPEQPQPTAPREGGPPTKKGEWLDFIHDVHRSWIKEIKDPRHVVDKLLRDPINDVQLLGACASFVVSVRETFDDNWRSQLQEADWDAWARVWIEITCRQGLTDTGLADYLSPGQGFLAGTENEPIGYAAVAAASERILKQNYVRTLSGVRLASNLTGDLEDGVPRAFRRSIRVGVDVYGDPRVNRLLLIPTSPCTNIARRFMSRFPGITDKVLTRYVRMVLRKLQGAPPLSRWDQIFSPSQNFVCGRGETSP